MDRMPGGGAPDGAFERFLTAALATIITIMFSWRLLQDENEASGANDRDRGAGRDWTSAPQSTDFEYHRQARERFKKHEGESSPAPSARPRPPLGGDYDISLDELDVDDDIDIDTQSHVNNSRSQLSSHVSPISDPSVHETVTYDRFDPVKDRPLGATAPSTHTADSLSQLHDSNVDPPASEDDTLTTWDDYNWQEDTDEEQNFVIKTRRSGRDFAKSKQNALQTINNTWSALAKKNADSKLSNDNDQLTTSPNDQTEAQANGSSNSSPYLSFSQRLASFEYSDTGGDSGYVDLYPDVDTDESSEEESSDEEHEYEIQVSDSDSDSPDERTGGGSFYGMTALDTIFEEFESDIEEEGSISDKTGRLQGHVRDKGDKGPLADDKIGRYVPRIPGDRDVYVDNTCSSSDKTDVKQMEHILNDNLTHNKQVDPVINYDLKASNPELSELKHSLSVQEDIEVPVCHIETETSPFSNNQTNVEEGKDTRYALHNVERTLTSQAENPKHNPPPTTLNTTDGIQSNSIHKGLVDSTRSENSDRIDCDVNNTAPLSSGISHQNTREDLPVTGHRVSNTNRQAPGTEIGVAQRDIGEENNASRSDSPSSTFQIEFSKLQEKMKAGRLGQLQKDSTSEASDDGSPSSPVRNIALDHLADDRFSDTESCSSESVITVISVKSTESDGCPGERHDVTRDSCLTPVHGLDDVAGGDSADQLARINTSDSSYEHNSLVSGFLNDSLNSLLSANNINELGGESDLDLSEIDRRNSSSNDEHSDSDKSKVMISEIPESTDEQSESSSKTSSADSLSIVLARVEETNQINTELSNQAASSLTKVPAEELRIEGRISDAITSRDIRILDDDDDVTDRFIGSDSSSDSSDPPLREYDPDDDDLAAFQFNQDMDNDSFYLLVGDEGSLRNYETFTNLNSIGLNTEYHDAFTSRAFPDEARGFKFSRTEDLGTQFQTKGYFTERSAVSDSDSTSDKGLSPIASEDEGMTCLPENEPFQVVPMQVQQIEQVSSEQPSIHLSPLDKYKDAELSTVTTTLGTLNVPSDIDQSEQKSIDFQKYIIQPEKKSEAIKPNDQEGTSSADSQNRDKDLGKTDKEFIETKGSTIDNDQLFIKRSGVNNVNNTLDTNATSPSRVPQTHSTETTTDTTQSSIGGRDGNTNETDLDQYICADNDPIRGDELEVEDYRDKSRLDKAENEFDFKENDNLHARDQSKVCDSDQTDIRVKIETNIDDFFTESVDENNIVTEDQSEKLRNLDTIESNKTPNKLPRETCIDDIFVENNISALETSIDDIEHQTSELSLSNISSSNSRIETNIDDLFEQTIASDNSSRSSNGNKSRETNIDDIWDEPVTSRETASVTSSQPKIETNIDDIFNEPITPRASVDVKKQPRAKVETNIDDIFDDIVPDKVTPVQSTPLKQTAIETNVDDILSDDAQVTNNKHSPTKHKKSVETFVDDLFVDVGLTGSEISEQKPDELISKPQSDDKLSYETFVDDLFSNVLSDNDQCSSIANDDSNVDSSHRAINQAGRSSSVKDSRTHVVAPQSVQVTEIVSPDVCSVQQTLPDGSGNTSPGQQIEREIGTNKTADPKPEFKTGLKSLSSSDNTRGDVDIDNDCLDLNVNPSVSIVECQNTISKQGDPSSAKIRHHEIGFPDNTGPQICTNSARNTYTKPSTYSKNNGDGADTIIDDNDTISTENTIENNELLKNNSERETAINESPDNAKYSEDSNYAYLNRQKHRDIDYNANVSLPKSGGLNIVINSDNRPGIGSSPVGHNPTRTSSSFGDTQSGSLDEVEEIVNTLHEQYGITNANDIVLKIVEEEDSNREPESECSASADPDTYSSIGSCSIHSDDDSLSSIEESYHSLQSSYNSARLRGLSDSSIGGRVVRTPVVKPSAIFGKSKEYQGVKRRVHKHQLKKYSSILQQPITLDSQHVHLDSPEKPVSVTRLKVLQSRQRFLSAENLSNNSFEDRFLQYRTSLASSTPRKYLKRHERSLTELQSTESLPANMSAMDFMHSGYDSYNSMDRIHSLPVSRQIEELYNSRYSSANSSFERREYDKLHANCMFSPEKREEIQHTTKSLENMFEQLLRYGSVSSLATETDLDAATAATSAQSGSFPPDIDITDYISFQYPLERAASMSALTGSNEGHRLPRKPGKGRFASRNVPKSKSLQTLETNLDDVFASEDEFAGELKKVPSVHELRVSKSLSKLHVPDWFRKSSFSRSGSTQSLFTYASRQGSTSTLGSSVYPCSITTSPSPSVTPGSQAVIISKRVTASPTTPTSTAKLLRAPLLPTTPERSPIHNTPSSIGLPSDRFRTNDKKELKPIAIVPFAKLREMFEKKAQQDAHKNANKSPVTSPTEDKPPSRVRFEPTSPIRKDSSSVSMQSPKKETVVDFEPVQNNNRTISPPPAIPDRKPILADSSRKSESTLSNAQPARRMQVHFSDEKTPVEHVSKTQEQHQNANNVRHNGSAPSTNTTSSNNKGSIESREKPPVKKPSGFRASLPLPQFRFRRPGVFASKSSSSSSSSSTQQSANTQNKKGKSFYDNNHMHAGEHSRELGDYNLNNVNSVTVNQNGFMGRTVNQNGFMGNNELHGHIGNTFVQPELVDRNGHHEPVNYRNKQHELMSNLNKTNGIVGNNGKQVWLHVLETKTKIDGETLFEFLQKRRYSSILENGFAEQLEELQDRDVAFNFPVVSLGNHSGGDRGFGPTTVQRSPDLQVVLTNAYSNHSAPYDYVNNKLRDDASMDDILDGLLLLDGHSTGRLRMDENGRIVPKYPEDSPDTPPGFTMNSGNVTRDMYKDGNDNSVCDVPDSEYMLVKCEHAECKRETNLKEAKLYFKACHSCFTYYCSRQCRKDDWVLHKKSCIYSRINSACKHVIKCINRQPDLQYQCSRIARRGYLAQGRGCVMFAFPDISSSEDFLSYGFESLWVPPVYVSLRELPNASMLGSKLEVLTETCMNYNPELKYVIHVAVVIPPKLPLRPIPRRIESIIQKSAKLRLSPAHMHPRQENSDGIPSTLILTAVPGNQHACDVDGQKTRELCFINIQRKLRQRGVSLRHKFPDVYNKLIDFVSDAKHFSPMIIYPSDGRTGRKFMCVIMPESEPEIEWIRDPNLFRELDVFEEEEVTSTPNLSLNLHEVLL